MATDHVCPICACECAAVAELERLRAIEAAARALNSQPGHAVTERDALAALRDALAEA